MHTDFYMHKQEMENKHICMQKIQLLCNGIHAGVEFDNAVEAGMWVYCI